MNWKIEIIDIEKKRDWKAAIELLEKSDEKNKELYLRVIFILIDFVVEGKYTLEEHDYVAKKLKHFYDNIDEIFFNDAEFLFFIGIMIFIGEWYFGFDSIEPAIIMLQKAMDIEPQNVLYKWGYYSRIDQRPEQNTDMKLRLSEQLLFKDSQKLFWLRDKGLLGEYVLCTLEESYKYLNGIKSEIPKRPLNSSNGTEGFAGG